MGVVAGEDLRPASVPALGRQLECNPFALLDRYHLMLQVWTEIVSSLGVRKWILRQSRRHPNSTSFSSSVQSPSGSPRPPVETARTTGRPFAARPEPDSADAIDGARAPRPPPFPAGSPRLGSDHPARRPMHRAAPPPRRLLRQREGGRGLAGAGPVLGLLAGHSPSPPGTWTGHRKRFSRRAWWGDWKAGRWAV